jgi:hypothetical protein
VVSRYGDYGTGANDKDSSGLTLNTDYPTNSSVHTSMQFQAAPDAGNTGSYLYQSLAAKSPSGNGYDELWLRWYVKYQPGIIWHHSGMWFGGYNPPSPGWANPNGIASKKPAGNEEVDFAMEPIWATTSSGQMQTIFDFYNYWMGMHTCTSCNGAYWGNAMISQSNFTIDSGSWDCMEVHVKLNTDMASATGSMMEAWKNDNLVQSFSATSPGGGWIQDHYCPPGADLWTCSGSYFSAGPANIQFRTTTSLQLNYFWPHNYVTTTGQGVVNQWYADMVVATQRIGCISP